MRATNQSKSCGSDLAGSRWSCVIWGVPISLLCASAWGGGLFQAVAWPLSFALMGGACLVNARKCGRTHCHVTAPLYLIAALLSVGAGLEWEFVSYRTIAVAAAIGTAGAHAWEWGRGKYLREVSAGG